MDANKIFHLNRPSTDSFSPWGNTDEIAAFVIVAADEQAARRFAADSCSGEGADTWLNNEDSTCVELGSANAGVETGIILTDTLTCYP